MIKVSDETQWAQQEFQQAQLGDLRRSKRRVQIAAGAARRPDGQITAVFEKACEREAAFRFLENPKVDAESVAAAAHQACAMRCGAYPFVFVPADGTSLNLCDGTGQKGFGTVGTHERGARGLLAWTALGLSAEGMPLGVLGQRVWARTHVAPTGSYDPRTTEQKETQHILDLMHDVQQVVVHQSPQTVPWLQVDRGGDAWAVLLLGGQLGVLLTVRAGQDRRLVTEPGEAPTYLWQSVEQSPALGGYVLSIPRTGQRAQREAAVVLRAQKVRLRLGEKDHGPQQEQTLWAVLCREVGGPVPKADRIEWMLLTNYPVETQEDALVVVQGYTYRWRVEQFHRLWKSECCNVERTQLRSLEGVKKWMAVLASVAMRVERIVYLSRQEAGQPATVEFTQPEIDATILLCKPTGYQRGDVPTISQVARWVADLGGYTGKSSGGPFGTKVLSRGLEYIASAARLLSLEQL